MSWVSGLFILFCGRDCPFPVFFWLYIIFIFKTAYINTWRVTKSQMLMTLRKIRWVPKRAVVCRHPITSGMPRSSKYFGSLLGTVPNAPITMGITLVLTWWRRLTPPARTEYLSTLSSSLFFTLASHWMKKICVDNYYIEPGTLIHLRPHFWGN